MQGVLDGITSKASAIIDKIRETGRGAKDAWDSFWSAASPSRLMIKSAQDIMQGAIIGWQNMADAAIDTMRNIGNTVATAFIDVIKSKTKDTDEAIKEMLNIGSKFSGFAGFFGNLTVNPDLQIKIDGLTDTVNRFNSAANDIAGVDLGLLNNAELGTTEDALKQMRGLLDNPILNDSIANPFAILFDQFNNDSPFRTDLANKLKIDADQLANLNAESIDAILKSIDHQQDLNNLIAQQREEEERIAKIKQQQQDLAFLQQQLDLIKLIKDSDLAFEAEIFEGIQFGLGADPADILNVTASAMNAIVQQASQDLSQQVGLSTSQLGQTGLPVESSSDPSVQNSTNTTSNQIQITVDVNGSSSDPRQIAEAVAREVATVIDNG